MGVGRYIATLLQWLRTRMAATISMIGIADVVDMLIIAFILYKFMRFLRQSRLGVIAKSILLLVAVVWLSGQLGLLVVNFATSRAIEMGILALVILFQQEIRQSLERIGRGRLTNFSGKDGRVDDMDMVIAQTVIACQKMSKERTGALIVFERSVSLGEEVKTGTRLDARISAELLRNIFYDKAPLHDGALIVREGRIISASCVLPLSDNETLSRDLGMRHRAAIGVSEKSDAVTVVVSEESGAISVAIDGRLRRHLTPEIFERILQDELIEKETKRGAAVWNLLKGKRHEKSGK